MVKIAETYLEEHESEMVKCPKCGSVDVVAKIDEKGYFSIYQCNKCGYIKKNKKPSNS
jgi:predicted RNA-binding Zn-ribbon protein involved in translation (DUF1610 family)